jgi:hypothetical protein
VSSTSQLVNNTESFVVKTNKCGQILGHYCLERKRYGRGPICIVVTRCGPHVMSSSPLESVLTFSSTRFCRTHIYWTLKDAVPTASIIIESSESQGNFESRTEDRQDPEQHFSFDLSDHVPGRLIDSVGHFFGRFLSHLSFRWFISGETKSPRYLSSTRYAVSTDNATERNSLIISPIAPIVLRATIKNNHKLSSTGSWDKRAVTAPSCSGRGRSCLREVCSCAAERFSSSIRLW